MTTQQTSRSSPKGKGSKLEKDHQKWIEHLRWLGIKVEKPPAS